MCIAALTWGIEGGGGWEHGAGGGVWGGGMVLVRGVVFARMLPPCVPDLIWCFGCSKLPSQTFARCDALLLALPAALNPILHPQTRMLTLDTCAAFIDPNFLSTQGPEDGQHPAG